jgi:hypothetical protein
MPLTTGLPRFRRLCVQHYDREGRLLAARPDEGWKQAQILSCVPGRCHCKATGSWGVCQHGRGVLLWEV